jgi:LCP family protein required for cell wall assembly
MKNKKKTFTYLGGLLILTVIFMVIFYAYIRSKVYTPDEIITQVEVNEEDTLTFEEVEGITNVLLIGVDAREIGENARADSIIIATIDNNTKKMKLSSIMRDTYVNIPGHGQQKINAALAIGGPELLMSTIKENFNFNVDKYVMINFWGFENVINTIDGVDLEIKDYEIDEINKYIGEVDAVKSQPLMEAGMQHLDGQQALAYARIRKVGNGCYERTERQRRVINIVAEKMMDVSPIKYPILLADLIDSVQTNIEPVSILNYAYTVYKFGELNFEQLQIPKTELSEGIMYKDQGWVLLIDKVQNGRILNDFIYRDIIPTVDSYSLSEFKEVMAEYNRLNREYASAHEQVNKEEETKQEVTNVVENDVQSTSKDTIEEKTEEKENEVVNPIKNIENSVDDNNDEKI